jgi:hypothetical protein
MSTDGSTAHGSRSGDDVTEAVEVAERGTAVDGVHDQPERNKPGQAPVEQAAGDAAMTEGQPVGDAGSSGGSAEPESSGAAQAVRGARQSDLAAAGED